MLGQLLVLDIYQQYQSYWVVLALFSIVCGAQVLKKQDFPCSAEYPPVVNLTKEQIFNDPVNAYEAAIRENGPVIAVKKKGRMEIVVSEKYVSKVLVDEANFSFEKGVAKVMNMDFLMDWTNGTIFKDTAVLTNGLLSKRMNTVVKQVSPIFFSRATQLANTPDKASLDLFGYCQSTVSDAMAILLLGKKFLNHRNSQAVMWAANDVAELSGNFQNRSWFARTWPSIWRIVTFVKVVIVRFVMRLGVSVGRPLWNEMTRLVEDPTAFGEDTEDTTLLSLLVKKYTTPEKTLSFANISKIFLALVSAIFVSVHQVSSTMVWDLCELAMRPEYQEEIFHEIQELVGDGSRQLDFDLLKQAVHTDSFIREVMRTKGDTFSTVRMSVNDVQLGKTIVPKGYMVHPIASLAHRSPAQVGENPETFDGRRWVDKGKPATMTGPGHLAFGLGRWACPGRYLAVSELKLMVFSIFSKMSMELIDNKYEILDKLMIASAPPKAYFKLTERNE